MAASALRSFSQARRQWRPLRFLLESEPPIVERHTTSPHLPAMRVITSLTRFAHLRRMLKAQQSSNRGHGWIGVDLDGTLAEYHSWLGTEHIGDPVPAMLSRVKRWVSEGKEVRIFTARVSHPTKARLATRAIGDWCEKHGLPRLPVTNSKDFGMIELWDDRAVQVEINSGKRVDGRW